MIALTLLALIGKTPIVETAPTPGKFNPMFGIILLQCLIMAHLSISMQVDHITKSKNSPFRSRLMLLQVLGVIVIYSMHLFDLYSFTKDVGSNAIITMLALQLIFQTHYFLNIIVEISTALDIKILFVMREYPPD